MANIINNKGLHKWREYTIGYKQSSHRLEVKVPDKPSGPVKMGGFHLGKYIVWASFYIL